VLRRSACSVYGFSSVCVVAALLVFAGCLLLRMHSGLTCHALQAAPDLIQHHTLSCSHSAALAFTAALLVALVVNGMLVMAAWISQDFSTTAVQL
jgi:hypothetical protein